MKRCGKSSPADRVTGLARQTPPGARPRREKHGKPSRAGPARKTSRVGRLRRRATAVLEKWPLSTEPGLPARFGLFPSAVTCYQPALIMSDERRVATDERGRLRANASPLSRLTARPSPTALPSRCARPVCRGAAHGGVRRVRMPFQLGIGTTDARGIDLACQGRRDTRCWRRGAAAQPPVSSRRQTMRRIRQRQSAAGCANRVRGLGRLALVQVFRPQGDARPARSPAQRSRRRKTARSTVLRTRRRRTSSDSLTVERAAPLRCPCAGEPVFEPTRMPVCDEILGLARAATVGTS